MPWSSGEEAFFKVGGLQMYVKKIWKNCVVWIGTVTSQALKFCEINFSTFVIMFKQFYAMSYKPSATLIYTAVCPDCALCILPNIYEILPNSLPYTNNILQIILPKYC